YQGRRHTVTAVSDGFDGQGATYPSLSAIARAITGTAWSGPRFFALARGNGAPARRNKNARAREGRDGSQPARGMNASEMNTASLPLQTALKSLKSIVTEGASELTWDVETRLAGWACEIRTQKCRRKLSL